MSLATALQIGGAWVLLLGNAFFVSSEFALTRVRQFPRDAFADTAGLRRAWEMTGELEIYLSGCQVGITIMSVGLGVVAEPALTELLRPLSESIGVGGLSGHALSIALSLGVINLLHVVLGEQAPTYLGVERTRLIAHYLAPPLYWWTKAMYPVIWVADRTTKGLLGLFGVRITRAWTEAASGEDGGDGGEGTPRSRGQLRARIGELLSRGRLTRDRRREVMRALDIGRIPVREVMVPRQAIVSLRSDRPVREALATLRRHAHVRFPLVRGTLEEFRGIVYTPSLFPHLERLRRKETSLQELAYDPLTVRAETPVSEVIDRFQTERQEMALVTDEGRVVGLVTSTDLWEAITGELEDPTDVAGGGRGGPGNGPGPRKP